MTGICTAALSTVPLAYPLHILSRNHDPISKVCQTYVCQVALIDSLAPGRRSSATVVADPLAPGLSGPLTIMVLEAEDLPYQSSNKLHCDPYCTLKLGKHKVWACQ